MTAIAAVLAATSTPALAQEVTTTEPVVETAPEPVTTTDPLAAQPATAPMSAVESATTEASPAAPAEKPVRKVAAKPVRSTANRPTSSAPTAPVAAAPTAAAPAPAAGAAIEAPLPVEAAIPVAEPIAPTPTEPAGVAANDALENALPIAGAAGLGILALAGAGMAVRRRKRRAEDEGIYGDDEWVGDQPVAYSDPVSSPEPAFARAPEPSPAAVIHGAPVTALPAGFDLSRYGRHVHAAYRGPTPDNPSLSLKNRLRRASFFDQQERRAAQATGQAPKPSAEKPARENRQPNNTEFMLRPAVQPAFKLKPAYQG
ncbi:hypothetical protein [Sphingomonas edaphi]|uniref:LPXTG cell wall anchor domain-containing protein n=1 Tax=Sphingomonas edaphi TaxID=2315689 RepID=A0A418Q3J7_9SPHN|nr:hypothetical protein [Sphingomonas edaphi]RIX32471.1 hypothetical protein D3M59_05905 [Sphingomonas edaphi]